MLAGLTLLLVAIFLLSLVVGSTWIPIRRVIEALLGTSPERDGAVAVVETIRLPR